MMFPSLDQANSVARNLLQIVGTLLMAYGLTNEGAWEAISGAVVMMVPIVWGLFKHSKGQIIASAAKLSDVEKIVTKTQAMAVSIPSPKVVSR
jgi:hypothetical protein